MNIDFLFAELRICVNIMAATQLRGYFPPLPGRKVQEQTQGRRN
jgi:hypothetical protein